LRLLLPTTPKPQHLARQTSRTLSTPSTPLPRPYFMYFFYNINL